MAQTEERRIVTVLFADLVGFTTMAEHLDPEQLKRFIDSCFERLVDDVASFGGRVDKILGDGILALFGAPVGHEDDPERAVRAALRMHQTLAAFVATNSPAGARVGASDIRMRIGINTGEVLVGTLAGTDYTAMGDVVNTASRLQGVAPPGGVLVGPTTHALTTHCIRYDSFGELIPRGREQAMAAWLAVEPTAPPGSARRKRREVRLVGREAEMAIARAALDVVCDHRGVLVAVSGENGVGTTRLIDELVDYMRTTHDAAVLAGAGVPYGESNVWWPIASALAAYLDLEPGQSVEAVRAVAMERALKLTGEVATDELEQLIDIFVHLQGYPSPIDRLDPANARRAIHRAVTRVLELRSFQRPVVLTIDDLHWADPALIELLDHLVASLGRSRFALITAMRPGSDLSWPPRTERATVVSLPLLPLSQSATETLAAELLGDAPTNARQLTALFERSGGNPLFLQELAALTRSGGNQTHLPGSLRTLIGARLDQLTTEQRQVLDNAATLGNSGTVADLDKFGTELGQTFHAETVNQLDELGLLELRGRRWQFRSESVREAAYQTLTKERRAMRHAGIAKAIRSSGHRLDDLAHHTATAAELANELGGLDELPAGIADEAVLLLTESAQRSLDSGALRTCTRTATRALDLLPNTPENEERRSRLLLLRASAAVEQRQFAPAHADLDLALTMAERANDTVAEGESRRLLGSLAHVEGHMDLARAELGRSVELLRMTERPDRLADALRARGFIELFGGSLGDAEWFFGEADDLYRSAGDERGLAWIEQHRAWASFLSGDMTQSRERLLHAAETLERVGDRNGVGWAFGLLAFVSFFERDYEEAEALADIVAREADERGDDWAAGMMQVLLADLRLWQGHLEESLGFAEQARRKFKAINDGYGTMQALAPIVRSQIALGRAAAAQRSLEELLSLSEQESNGPYPVLAAAGAAMHRGDGAGALMYADRAIEEMHSRQGVAFEPTIVRAVALAQLHRLDEALATIEDIAEEGDDHPFATAAAILVEALSGNPKVALELAEQLESIKGATYLDQVIAFIGVGCAHHQLGDVEQATLSLEASVARAIGVGDVVATALATGAYEAITGRRHAVHDERTVLGPGWANIIEHLTDIS